MEYIDSMAIPADAPHPEAALKWIDYNLRPDVMAGTANAVNARTGVKENAELVRPELLADSQTYPTPEIEKTLFTGPVASRAYDRLRSRAFWLRGKFLDEFEHSVANTPCEAVTRKNKPASGQKRTCK